MDSAYGSHFDEAAPGLNKWDRQLLDPVFSWLYADEQRSLNAERVGALLGVPPSTVRGWPLPPPGEPALPWLLARGGEIATHYRQHRSR